ncbi:MAG: hypothetical protein GY838_04700 [bacterium]|nr:hypothetical protein [bacterium]
MTRFLTIGIIFATAAAATAATPRVQALGGDGAYLEDAGNVLRWSGSLADHAGRAAVGTGTFDGHGYPRDGARRSGPWAGVQFALGGEKRPFAGALYLLSRSADQGNGSFDGERQFGAFHALAGLRAEDLTATASWRRSDAAAGLRGERRDDVGLGFRLPVDTNAYADVVIEISNVWPHSAYGDTLSEDNDKGVGHSYRGRLFVGLSETLVLVTVAAAETEDRDWGTVEPAHRQPFRHLRVGTALTWLPDPDRLALFSVEYREIADPHVWIGRALLCRAALEARLNAFLSLRAAVGWEDRLDPDASIAPLSCGLAVHALDWDLDLAVGTVPPLDATGRRPGYSDAALGWMSAALSLAF